MAASGCLGCGEAVPGGMEICGQYLCPECEARLVRSKVEEIDYQHWIDSWRGFWEKMEIDLEEAKK